VGRNNVVDKLAKRLLNSTDLLDVVPTICYRAAIQQFFNKLCMSDKLVAT
jgi:hypothetical protein